MSQLIFTLPEILALIGIIQCTYLIVHVGLRPGQIARAGLPLLYFVTLGAAFTGDLVQSRLGLNAQSYFYLQWGLWFLGPPLSVLVVIQLADMSKRPPFGDFWVLLLVPLSFMLAVLAGKTVGCAGVSSCAEMPDLLNVTGLMAGTISLLVIFSKKNLLKNLSKQKYGKERYWLILSLIILNACFLLSVLLGLTQSIESTEAIILRSVLGLGFVYLVSTSLLRLFPKAKRVSQSGDSADTLSEDEQALAQKVESLLDFEKVYQEPTYSRADLAKECGTSETTISRVINMHFQKSFPQLMNEHRIEDAKRLLRETDAPVRIIAQNVGFNSLPSFNRVFKDTTGAAPSVFRKSGS